jgi:DNA polymerase bacteriophage-type
VNKVEIDFETRSYADLKKVGVWGYAEDATTDVICLCYDLNDGAGIQDWVPGQPMPYGLRAAVVSGWHFEAHNYSFECSIWANVMVKKYGWPPIALSQWRDTMAVACYYALPAALDRVSSVLGFEGKDPDGGRLITKYSKLHLKTAKASIPPEDLQKFITYCRKDVAIEQSVSDFLGDLPEREHAAFELDKRVNMRGLYLDIAGIECAAKIVDQRSDELRTTFREITGFNPTQNDKVRGWFNANGLALENMQAETVEEVLEDGELGQGLVRRALEIRLAINKASTKKLDAMARQRGSDGRARFQSRYHGAQTGRDTGSGFQPLNLVRSWEDVDPDQLVRDIMYGDAGWLDAIYGDAMAAISKASRHWIMAEPGNQILAGDFVSIEAVVLACLAGEDWKVQAFRDRKPIYEMMGDKIHNLPPGTVTKKTHPAERQDGKTGELAFGYQGALGAWLNFDSSGRHSDERIIEICKAWRSEHPAIVAMWRGLESAAIDAVRNPGRETSYRDVGFVTVDQWLAMILPNGKHIWYWKPELRMGMPAWHKPQSTDEKYEDCRAGTCDCRPMPKLSYMAQKEGQWKRVYTYGGKLTENAVQATSRELLVPAALALEDAGYPIVLKVYDELVAEIPQNFGSKREFDDIMRQAAGGDWSRGWPVNCDSWAGERYKK